MRRLIMLNVTVMGLAFLASGVPLFAQATSSMTEGPGMEDTAVIYLVRHTEKVDDSRDPDLSERGRERASELAALLRDAEITRVFSTNFIRTRETARPLAEALGIEVELYDPTELLAFAEQVSDLGERVLVVGHSNTTPMLVEALGGVPGTPIHEPSEYDRLYVVTLPHNGSPSTVLLRYGEKFDPSEGGGL